MTHLSYDPWQYSSKQVTCTTGLKVHEVSWLFSGPVSVCASFLSGRGMLTGVPGWIVEAQPARISSVCSWVFCPAVCGPRLAAGNNGRRQTEHRLFVSSCPHPLLKRVKGKGPSCHTWYISPCKDQTVAGNILPSHTRHECCDSAFLLGFWVGAAWWLKRMDTRESSLKWTHWKWGPESPSTWWGLEDRGSLFGMIMKTEQNCKSTFIISDRLLSWTKNKMFLTWHRLEQPAVSFPFWFLQHNQRGSLGKNIWGFLSFPKDLNLLIHCSFF